MRPILHAHAHQQMRCTGGAVADCIWRAALSVPAPLPGRRAPGPARPDNLLLERSSRWRLVRPMSERGAFSMRLRASANSRSVKLSPMPRGIAVTRFCAKDAFHENSRGLREIQGQEGGQGKTRHLRKVKLLEAGHVLDRTLREVRDEVPAGDTRPRRQRQEDASSAA
jgi:hypothetical protein